MASPFEPENPWIAVFGRMHPMLLHLPIGLWVGVALCEFGPALLRKNVPRKAVLALAGAAALAGLLTAAAGYTLAGETSAAGTAEYAGVLVDRHRALGILAALFGFAAACAAASSSRVAFRLLLGCTLWLIAVAGHLGASITHGEDFLFEPLRRSGSEGGSEHHHGGGSPGETGLSFESTVAPILARRCTLCHGETKQKGGLRLDSAAGISKGSEDGPVFVPGKPDESPIVRRLELPLADDDHMPPEGKPQPSPEEVAAVRSWIEQGARFGHPIVK
ncbi:MAG: hypothetical protein Fur0037_06080 [Planctomycetota bacterium]